MEKEIAVIGDSRFTLGFRLLGIKKVKEFNEQTDVEKAFESMMDQTTGIIITEESVVSKLNAEFRRKMESSVSPVVVILSERAAQDALREMIKRAIGVDLLESK